MKLLTRMTLLFLTALALVTAAYAEHSDTDIAYAVMGGNLYFDKATGTVTECEWSVTEAVIPARIDGVAVTAIGSYAFDNCYRLKSVTIPEGVISLGKNAFAYCSDLESAKIPNSVTSIGDWAFFLCRSLKSAKISSNVVSMGGQVFSGCSSLAAIDVEEANANYVSLNGVLLNKTQTQLMCYPGGKTEKAYRIPDSVSSIDSRAFFEAANLESVEIPDSVISIKWCAFEDCSSLKNIAVAEGNENYSSLNGVLCNKTRTNLVCYPAGKAEMSYNIPDGISSIEEYAFSGTKALQYVAIPNSVTFIGNLAFARCSGLISVELPNSITSIPGEMFNECFNLKTVRIPDSITYIGSYAFVSCNALQSIGIPDSVTSIGMEAFWCDNLRDVYYGGSKAQWEQIEGLAESRLISDNITIHYNSAMPDTPDAPEFAAPSAPTVGGRAISKADLSGLTEISVPVSVSADTPTQVTLCVPFFDGGKFLGMGFVTATVDKNTDSVTVPVTGDVSGAGKLSVIFADADFRPLSVGSFDIAA